MLIDIIAGKRADFIRLAPVIHAIKREQDNGAGILFRLIYGGSRNDHNADAIFFQQLKISTPDVSLEVATSAASDTEQIATLMVRYEKSILVSKPHVALIAGDSNTAIACTVTAKKNNITIFRFEGGHRNQNRKSQDEINRRFIESNTDYFFTSSRLDNEQLHAAGVEDERIFFTGSIMPEVIQTYRGAQHPPPIWERFLLGAKDYVLVTIDRPEHLTREAIHFYLGGIIKNSNGISIIMPVNGVTKLALETTALKASNLHIIDILSFTHFYYLLAHSKGVITDSGTLQEAATVLHLPCITIGTRTDRPETIHSGTNELAGNTLEHLSMLIGKIFSGQWEKNAIPYMWDGRASERIATVFRNIYKASFTEQE